MSGSGRAGCTLAAVFRRASFFTWRFPELWKRIRAQGVPCALEAGYEGLSWQPRERPGICFRPGARLAPRALPRAAFWEMNLG